MLLPDYTNSNIVNLACSILKAFDIEPVYPSLPELIELKNYTNVVLLLIDGLGYEYLKKNGQDSLFKKHLIKRLSSVIPTTTASAVTTLETGVAPQQHGITGWFMLLKELGLVAKVLPFMPRYGGLSFPNDKIQRDDIYTEKRINEKINHPSYILYPGDIIDGKVNKKSRTVIPYKNLRDMFSKIRKIIKSSGKRKYIYSYWGEFDTLCHREGTESFRTEKHFRELDSRMELFLNSLKGTNSTVIITSDHGLVDTEKFKTVILNDFPEIYDSLTLPLCGEPRFAYCYVHPDKAVQFEKNIKKNLGHCCDIYKSSDLIAQNAFGLYEPHRMLKHRLGDYALIMKENFIIKDILLKEKTRRLVGHHGGLSKEEMYVPLIWIRDI